MLSNSQVQKGLHWMRQVGSSPLDCHYVLGPILQPTNNVATVALSVDTLYAIPFIHGRDGVIDIMEMEVTTGGGGGAVGRFGIYTNTSPNLLYPDRLIIDSGQFSFSGTGVKTAAVSQRLPRNSLLWAVVLIGGAGSTVRAITGGGANALLGYPLTIGAAPYTELIVALAYAALPATFPAGATPQSASHPACFVHYSS